MYKNKKVCSLLIAVAMLVTLIPFNAIAVLAAELSSYETSDGRKIESISAVGTVDIIESTGGWWETGDQGTFYRYDIMSTKPTVTINFDNGDIQNITYDQYLADGGYNIENSNYRLWFDSYQSYGNQWHIGENIAYVYLQILDENDAQVVTDEDRDTAVEFKVNIIESPVESINVILDKTFIENTGGVEGAVSYWDEETQTFVEKSFYDYGYMNYATIDIVFKPDSQYANLSGSYGWWELQNLISGYGPSTIDNQPNWNGAGTYTAAIEYMGCTSPDFNIVINPSPVVSITATMNQEITEGTCGWLCSGEEEYYYYNYNEYATYTVEFLDGSGYESGTYTANDLNCLIPDVCIQQLDDQNTSHWNPGTNKGKVSYMGCESPEFDVVITENPIESITITTDDYLSDADCNYFYSAYEEKFVGMYDINTELINNWIDLQIEVEYSDGRENEVFTTNNTKDNYYGNSGHEFSLSYWQEAENWQFGQNEITAYFDGTETKFNIELRDEVESVTVNSKNNEYIRGALFYYREDFDSYETAFQYHNDIETIEVTFTDGRVKEYSWSMGFADNVESLLFSISPDDENKMALMQRFDFSECGTQSYPIVAWGQIAYVDVEIVDTTISAMTATCNKKLIKDFSGYWEEDTFVYDVPTDFFSDDLSLKIEYKDGTKETYSKSSLSGSQERLYPVTVTEREDDPISDWGVGTHKVDVTLKNFTTTMDVEVIDVPVESIELSCENNKLYENGSGYYDDDKFYYDMPQTDEIEVTLNYFDGTSFTCKLDELFDETGYDYMVSSNQSEDNLWAIDDGEEHYFVISYLGVEGKLPVEIIETNVKSMTTTLNATMMKDVNVRPVSHFEFSPDGWGDWIIDGYKYNIPYYNLVSEIEFKDGTTGTYTYEELLEIDPYLATYDDQGKDGVWWGAGEHTASLIFNGYESKYVITIYAENPNEYPEIEMISKSDVNLGWKQSSIEGEAGAIYGPSTGFSFEDFSLYLPDVDYKAYVSLDDNETFEEYDLKSVLEDFGAKLDDVEWPMSTLINLDGVCYMLFSGSGFGPDNEREMRGYLVEVVDWETEEFNVYSMPFAKTGFDYFEPTLAKKDDTFVYIVGTKLYTSKDLTTWTVHDNIDDLLMESDENQYNQTSVWVSDGTVFVSHNIFGEDGLNPVYSEIFVTTDFTNYKCLTDEVDKNLTGLLNKGKIGQYEAFLFGETKNFHNSDWMGYTYDYGFYIYIPESQSFEEITRSNIEMNLENGDVCYKTIVNTVVTNPGYYQSLEYGDFVLTLVSDNGEIKAKYEIPYSIASEGSTDSLINEGQEQNGRKYAYFIKTISTYDSEAEKRISKLLVTDNYFKSYYVFDLPGVASEVYLSNDKTKLVASGTVYDEETGDATSEIWTCDWNKIVEQFDNAVGFTNDEVTGVSVDTTDYNTMSSDISLEVSELDESDLVGNVKPEGEFEIYDITLMEDGEEQQPEEGTKVKVTIDVPEGYNGEEMKIYRAEEDGTYTDMNATYDEETNTLVYYTEHFSKYLIAKGISSIIFGDVNGDGEVNAKDVTILERYVAKWDDIEIVDENSDLNSDGLINAKGVTILARYIAKWAEYISLPFKK